MTPQKSIVLQLPSSSFAGLFDASGKANEDFYLNHRPGSLCFADMEIRDGKVVVKLLLKPEGWTVEQVPFKKIFNGAKVVQ